MLMVMKVIWRSRRVVLAAVFVFIMFPSRICIADDNPTPKTDEELEAAIAQGLSPRKNPNEVRAALNLLAKASDDVRESMFCVKSGRARPTL